jgi:HTH-type transcriptional regulator, transcriptional repressor of NAD biosynthesis genes
MPARHAQRSKGRGMVLGKFMPPHLGHQYLVDFARHYVDELAVVVEHVRDEPIPSALRFGWMRELFPSCDVVHLLDENPQDPSEHPDFWDIWKHSLERVLPYQPDFVFASESYGAKLAEVLSAEFIPVDPARSVMPVSGTAVRLDPWANWHYLPECVRPHFVKRVCVFGPESTGKSTLTNRLAEYFGTIAVPEYARALLELQQGALCENDMWRIARGQLASEDALARKAHRLLFCDTDTLTTTIWGEVLFGRHDERIAAEAQNRRYDLTLLLDVDVPWVADEVRYLPGDRRSFFERCRDALERHQRPYVVIRGDWDQRWKAALEAGERLLSA